jgi:glutathione S-transferase
MLPDPRLLLGAFAPDLNAPRRLVARAMYPLMRRKIAADFGIDRSGIERAWRKSRLAGERFAADLQANGYLVGGGFTVADLTVAALLSPVVAPEQFPYPQPQRDHSRLARLHGRPGGVRPDRGAVATAKPRVPEMRAPRSAHGSTVP